MADFPFPRKKIKIGGFSFGHLGPLLAISKAIDNRPTVIPAAALSTVLRKICANPAVVIPAPFLSCCDASAPFRVEGHLLGAKTHQTCFSAINVRKVPGSSKVPEIRIMIDPEFRLERNKMEA
jgi:hypothetical protein